MTTLMVRYRTAQEHAAHNESLVRAVFGDLAGPAPPGYPYACDRLPDGESFVHLADLETPSATPLTALASFREFQRELRARCVELPVVTELTPVGAYGGVT